MSPSKLNPHTCWGIWYLCNHTISGGNSLIRVLLYFPAFMRKNQRTIRGYIFSQDIIPFILIIKVWWMSTVNFHIILKYMEKYPFAKIFWHSDESLYTYALTSRIMKRNKFSATFTITIASAMTAIVLFLVYQRLYHRFEKEDVPVATHFKDIVKNAEELALPSWVVIPENTIADTEKTKTETPILPKELNLDAPFYSQAPFGNWDFPWQEACEEASILLAANVYHNKQWTREQFNQEILDMVDWQNLALIWIQPLPRLLKY